MNRPEPRTIRFKEWLLTEADRLRIDERTLRNRIFRGTHPMPPHRRINCRVIEVLVDELPQWGGLV